MSEYPEKSKYIWKVKATAPSQAVAVLIYETGMRVISFQITYT